MSAEHVELSVAQARDHFSDAVNRAAYGNEFTYVTRGRRHERAAAIVPAWVAEAYEQALDNIDGQVAAERLAEIRAGWVVAVPADEATATLGL